MVTVVAPAVDASAPICLMVTAPVSVAAEAAIFKAFKGLVPPPIIPPMPTVPLPLIMVKLSAFPAAVVALIVESKSIFPAPVVPVVTVIVQALLLRTKAPSISIAPAALSMSWLTVIVPPVKETSPISVPITAPPVLSKTIVPVPPLPLELKVTLVLSPSDVPLI